MDDNVFIKEIIVESYEDLINFIESSSFNRKDFIYRGIGNLNYELVPKALRRNEFDQAVINDYIGPDFYVKWNVNGNWKSLLIDSLKNFKISCDDYFNLKCSPLDDLIVDKYGNVVINFDKKILGNVSSKKELQIKREMYLLLKFLNGVDKTGLEVNVNTKIRRLIHYNINLNPTLWPDPDFFELISLAQHYGLPTEALDWSYRYESALYFSVKNILNDDMADGVLWAFNYKLYEDNYLPCASEKYKVQFYRPQYYMNPNLRAQRGLFTFIMNKTDNIDYRSLDKIVLEDLKIHSKEIPGNGIQISDLDGLNDFIIPEGQYVFYKFVIGSEIKLKILDELYKNGWSEKFMFPGYHGVVLSMKNNVKLDNLKSKNSENKVQKQILLSFNHYEVEKIRQKNLSIIFRKDFDKYFDLNISKIFIYSKKDNKILGYYNRNRVIKNLPENFWNAFNEVSVLSESEFKNYFKCSDYAFAIQLSDLEFFDYPIDCQNFNILDNIGSVELIDDIDSLKFLLNIKVEKICDEI